MDSRERHEGFPTRHPLSGAQQESRGKGRVYSYVIRYRPGPPRDQGEGSIIAVIALEEGPRILGELVEGDRSAASVRVNMPVERVPEDNDAGHGTPRFRPQREAGGKGQGLTASEERLG